MNNANQTVSSVKALLAKDAKLEAASWAAWNRVVDVIEANAIKVRPKMKSFEVHQLIEDTRVKFLKALLATGNAADAEATALGGLPI
jgi:hypothetical protein